MIETLSPDTKAILLLTAPLIAGKSDTRIPPSLPENTRNWSGA